MAAMTMARLFGEADLQRVAGERSFGRGQSYLDAVGDLEIGVGQVTATVYGTDAYEVVLDLGDDGVTVYYDTEMTQLSVAGGALCASKEKPWRSTSAPTIGAMRLIL